MAPTLQIAAALTRIVHDDGDYRFIARWRFDGSQSRLPRSEDEFRVSILAVNGGQWLQPDGSWSATPAGLSVRPVRDFMIQAPRERRRGRIFPQLEEINAAKAPTRAVDCAEATDDTLPAGAGLGVCNVLDEVARSRIAWRAASHLAGPLEAVLYEQGAANPSVLAEDFAHDLAVNLLRLEVTRATLAVRLREAANILRRGLRRPSPHLLTYSGGANRKRDRLQHVELFALVAAKVLRDEDLRAAVFRQVEDKEQLREQWLLKGHLGGKIIDFAPGANARTLPIAEAAGLGWTSRAIPPARVRQWAAAGETFEIGIEHIPAALDGAAAKIVGATAAGDIGLWDDDNQPGKTQLTAAEVRRASVQGTSHPPGAPQRALINYAMHEQEVDTDEAKTTRRTSPVTGEGAIGLIIQRPTRPSGFGFGYNVYGVPDDGGAASAAIFQQDPQATPLGLLKPFRITRRYSWEEDLIGPYPSGVLNREIIDDPPWEPVMPTPDVYTDGLPLLDTQGEVSNPVRAIRIADADLWAYDLRKGVAPAAGGQYPTEALWDPIAPAEPSWRPEETRTRQPAPRGQRYRFFVTHADYFGQEGEPLPVRAEDAEGGESASYDFVPRRRTPPGAVELKTPTGRGAADGLELTQTLASITFYPVFDQSLTPVADATAVTRIEGIVRLYRRPLREAVPQPQTLRADDPTADSELWNDEDRKLTEKGWRLFKEAVMPPEQGPPPRFTATWGLTHADWGFEYVAIAGIRLTDTAALLWLGRAAQRTVYLLASGSASSETAEMWESPAYGGLAVTDPKPLPNPMPPRPLRSMSLRHRTAKPVRAVPEIERDLVLMRLVERTTVDDKGMPVVRPDWGGAGHTLTEGQAVMLERALQRSWPSDDDPVKADALALARQLLAGDVRRGGKRPDGSEDPLPMARRTSVVGFRGVIALDWTYDSVLSQTKPGTPQESEALVLRAHWCRASVDAAANAEEAGLVLKLLQVDPGAGWVEVATPSDAAELAILESCGRVPALAAARGQGPVVTAWLDVLAVAPSPTASRHRLQLRPLEAAWPSVGETISLQVAALAGEQIIPETTSTAQGTLWLPVGGGQTEVGVWWLTPVSAQGRECTAAERSVVIRHLAGSLQPVAPVPTVRPPIDVDEYLDPSATDPFNRPMAEWLPTDLAPGEHVRTARTVVAWRPYPSEGPDPRYGVRILVERDRRRVGAAAQANLQALTDEAMAALEAIQGLSAEGAVKLAWLQALSRWLLGKKPRELRALEREDPVLHGFDRPLAAAQGLTFAKGQPALIDYFRDPIGGPDRPAMDGTFQYAYRLTAYRDLFPDDPSVELEHRYLLSRPSAWSGFVAPGVLPFAARELSRVFRSSPAPNPSATFSFAIPAAFRSKALAQGPWRTRVLVYRRLDPAATLRSLPAALPDDEAAWTLVGEPLVLSATALGGVVSDLGLARPIFDDDLAVTYQLSVQQFLAADFGSADETPLQGERLLQIDVVFPGRKETDPSELALEAAFSLDPV